MAEASSRSGQIRTSREGSTPFASEYLRLQQKYGFRDADAAEALAKAGLNGGHVNTIANWLKPEGGLVPARTPRQAKDIIELIKREFGCKTELRPVLNYRMIEPGYVFNGTIAMLEAALCVTTSHTSADADVMSVQVKHGVGWEFMAVGSQWYACKEL